MAFTSFFKYNEKHLFEPGIQLNYGVLFKPCQIKITNIIRPFKVTLELPLLAFVTIFWCNNVSGRIALLSIFTA
jgi:hypothetical protein